MYDIVGKTLDKYQIVELLYQTAVTEVYKGFNPTTNRFVLVNVLKEEFTISEPILKRFLEQNDIAAKVQHPNLLPLLDFGNEKGIYYRVLMYGTEGNWLENKHWLNNNHAILALFSRLSDVLTYIHESGYAFLNLSPANIFFGDQRSPMLGDFGIALSPEWSKTNPYCSPEARRGDPVDYRSDIYALGALLYEVLMGAPPDMNRYISLRTQRPDLPQDVEKVILKALSDNPLDRFQSVNTFQAALKSAFRYQPHVPGATTVQPAQQPKKNKTCLIILIIALIALCITTIAVGIPLLSRDKNGGIQEPTDVPTLAPTEEVAVIPTEPAPGDDKGDRPSWEFPDIDLPDLSEIPICKSLYPALGLGMFGLITMKTRKKSKHNQEDGFDE